MATNKLTDIKCKNAKASISNYKLSDGDGLYLMVLKSGAKSFRRNYRFKGKQSTYTFGVYPAISLARARELNRRVSVLLAEGKDPLLTKKQEQILERQNKPFSVYADEYMQKMKDEGKAESTLHDMELRIKRNLTPALDSLDMREIETGDLLEVLQVVSDRGAKETAIRLAGVLVKIFNSLVLLRIRNTNPATGLNQLLTKPNPQNKKNFKHIDDPVILGRLLRVIDNPPARQDIVVTQALKLMPHIFLRPVNIRHLKWEYVDFNEKLITIPRSEMKIKSANKPDFIIPLSSQVIEILKVIEPLTRDSEYLFISGRSKHGKPISEGTTTQQLKNRLIDPVTNKPFGVTSHGFRHTASTLMNELGFDADAIELQLDHNMPDLGSGTRAIYNKAIKLDARTKMMQEWSSYLDVLRTGSVVMFPYIKGRVA